jgi:hypothetical protein
VRSGTSATRGDRPAGFRKFISAEMNRWGKVVKEAGIKGE